MKCHIMDNFLGHIDMKFGSETGFDKRYITTSWKFTKSFMLAKYNIKFSIPISNFFEPYWLDYPRIPQDWLISITRGLFYYSWCKTNSKILNKTCMGMVKRIWDVSKSKIDLFLNMVLYLRLTFQFLACIIYHAFLT